LFALVFYSLATVVVVGALGVVLASNPVTCAVSLVVSLLGVAGLFGLAGAGFLAVVQVLVYVGAIVTLFTFVVMLLNLGTEDADDLRWTQQRLAAFLLGALFLGNVMAVFALLPGLILGFGSPPHTSIESLARVVFGRHALAFELTSVLLLAAVIGVVALARRERA